MSRNLLHVSKLEDFKVWLTVQGIETRAPRGQYQVLQIKLKDGQWACLYWREYMPEHLTVDKRIDNLVLQFLHPEAEDEHQPPHLEPENATCPNEPPWET